MGVLKTLVFKKIRSGLWTVVAFAILLGVLAGPLLKSSHRMRRVGFWLSWSHDVGSVVFVGDSIVAGWKDLAAAFPEHKVANRGLNGDRTVDVLNRLETDVLSLRPVGVVLLIGTNDLNSGAEPEGALANIEAIIRAVRGRFPGLPIVICKLMPRAIVPGRFPDQILELNAALDEAFRTDADSVVLDTWTLFADARGAPHSEDFPDLLHPGPKGYSAWAAALRPVLRARMPSSAVSRSE